MDTNTANYKSVNVHSIKNPQFLLVAILIEIFVILVGIPFLAGIGIQFLNEGKVAEGIFILLAIISVPVFIFFVIKAEIPGIVIDVENDKFSFRGGGVSPNSFLEYISPKFWIQSARRFEYRLSEVSSVAPDVEVHVSDKGGVSRSYYLRIAGTFGSAKIRVSNESKLQELCAVFVNVLNMGVPILNR